MTQNVVEKVCSLERLDEDNASPSRFLAGRAPKAHLKNKFSEADDLKDPRRPFVERFLVRPGFRVPRMRRRR